MPILNIVRYFANVPLPSPVNGAKRSERGRGAGGEVDRITKRYQNSNPETLKLRICFIFDSMMDTEKLLSEITELLKPYGIEKIILFGSYASGLQKSGSDIDILVDDEQRIQERIAIGDLFYKDIYTKGKVIYA